MIDIGIRDPQQKTIDELLRADISYEVPYFQREYSWKKDDWSDFVEDIIKTRLTNAGHFFGFMTFKAETNSKISIIEGQQRLTTVTILLSLIRDILYEQKNDIYKEIDTKYIMVKDLLSPENPPYPKIVLSELNKDFFKKYIQICEKPKVKLDQYNNEKNVNLSNQLILSCYKYFNAEIDKLLSSVPDENSKGNLLRDVMKTCLRNFVVISTNVDDHKAAFNIFQTLNNRGLDLTITDLLKIDLFEKAENNWKDAKEKWDEIREVLSNINMNSFLRHYWLSTEGVVSEKELLNEVEKKINNRNDVFKFLDTLKEEADNYEALLNPRVDYWEDKRIVDNLSELQILSVQIPLPFLLAACKKPTNEFNEYIKLCINVVFKYLTIAERENKQLEKIFSELAIALRNNTVLFDGVKTRLLKECPDDETFRHIFSKKEIKTNKVARYVLERIENNLSGECEKVNTKITLEHILPINPDDEWNSYIKENKIDKENCVNRMGNFTLLLGRINKKAQNRFFTHKRDDYYKTMTTLKINNDLKSISSWTEKDIEKRQLWLAQEALKTWKI